MDKQQKISVILMIILLGLVGYSAYNTYSINKLNIENRKLQIELRERKNKLKQVKKQQEQKFLQEAKNSTNPTTRLSAKQYLATDELSKQTNKFFKIVTTFNDQKSWVARQDKVRTLVTPNVLLNKTLFNNGLDNTGKSIIDTLGLNSDFRSIKVDSSMINGANISGIIHVTYESWKNQHSSGIRTDVYQVTYDLIQHKLTQVQLLGMENQGTDIEYNDN